jgi:hypothetical protein
MVKGSLRVEGKLLRFKGQGLRLRVSVSVSVRARVKVRFKSEGYRLSVEG